MTNEIEKYILPIIFRDETPYSAPENPLFSIIIPTLNEETYLERLLKEIIAQDFTDYEIIVSDSYSNDNTVNVAKGYGAYVVLTPPNGPGIARKAASDFAHGKYLIFMDSDIEIWNTSFLSELAYKLSENPEIEFATVKLVSNKNDIPSQFYFGFRNGGIRDGLATWCTGRFILVTNALDKEIGGFDEEILAGEDSDYTERIISTGRTLYFFDDIEVAVDPRREQKEGYMWTLTRYAWHEILTKVFGRKNVKKWGGNYKLGEHEPLYKLQ